jgi:hypothetical protein
MRDQINNRFQDNIRRARNLLAVYRRLDPGGQGRRSVQDTDVLRAATVFTHAALEEVFRGLVSWKYPAAAENILNEIPLVGITETGRPEKFFLGKLGSHRGKTVQKLIDESITAYVGNLTVNNTTEISGIIRKIGIEPETVNAEFAHISELVQRRHHIVHQADRNDTGGHGNHRAIALHPSTVEGWISAVERFVNSVLTQIPD